MAHFSKYTGVAARGIVAHCKRESQTEKSYIDPKKTHLNVVREVGSADKMINYLGARCLDRADVKKCVSLCVTLPKDVKSGDEGKFFRSVTNFMMQETADRVQQTYEKDGKTYEKNSIIGQYIHMDESTPHMHLLFVPVVKDTKKGDLKVSAKEWLTKDYLKSFHDRLSERVERDLSYKVTIAAEKHAERLKSENNVNIHVYRERQQAQLERLNQTIEAKQEELDDIESKVRQRTARSFSAFERSILDGDYRYDDYER